VYIQPLTKEFAQAYGVSEEKGAIVSDVMPDSPADKAGLRRGDVIIAVNKDKIEGSQELVSKIRDSTPRDDQSLRNPTGKANDSFRNAFRSHRKRRGRRREHRI
jgi:serine protease Do